MSRTPDGRRFDRLRGALRSVRDAWAIAGIVLLLVLSLELGLRLAFAVKDRFVGLPDADPRLVAEGYDGAPWVATHLREYEEGKTEWRPYVHFRHVSSTGETIRVDERGFRRTWSPPAPPGRDRPRVLVLGGSAAWGVGARDEFTIPSLLAKDLADRGLGAEVVNLAEVGYVSTQEVVELILWLRDGERADVVVFYDGVNDTLATFQSGEAGGLQNAAKRQAEFEARERPGLLITQALGMIARDSALSRLAGSLRARLAPGPDLAAGIPASSPRREARAERVLAAYEKNLSLVETLGGVYGFESRFYWQPILYTKAKPTPFEEDERRRFPVLVPFFLEVYRLARQRSNELGDHFRDLSGLLDDSDRLDFLDFCHTTEAANALIARRIADDVAVILRRRAAERSEDRSDGRPATAARRRPPRWRG